MNRFLLLDFCVGGLLLTGLCVFGFLANSLTLFVLNGSAEMRRQPINTYLTVLAIYDNGVLFNAILMLGIPSLYRGQWLLLRQPVDQHDPQLQNQHLSNLSQLPSAPGSVLTISSSSSSSPSFSSSSSSSPDSTKHEPLLELDGDQMADQSHAQSSSPSHLANTLDVRISARPQAGQQSQLLLQLQLLQLNHFLDQYHDDKLLKQTFLTPPYANNGSYSAKVAQLEQLLRTLGHKDVQTFPQKDQKISENSLPFESEWTESSDQLNSSELTANDEPPLSDNSLQVSLELAESRHVRPLSSPSLPFTSRVVDKIELRQIPQASRPIPNRFTSFKTSSKLSPSSPSASTSYSSLFAFLISRQAQPFVTPAQTTATLLASSSALLQSSTLLPALRSFLPTVSSSVASDLPNLSPSSLPEKPGMDSDIQNDTPDLVTLPGDEPSTFTDHHIVPTQTEQFYTSGFNSSTAQDAPTAFQISSSSTLDKTFIEVDRLTNEVVDSYSIKSLNYLLMLLNQTWPLSRQVQLPSRPDPSSSIDAELFAGPRPPSFPSHLALSSAPLNSNQEDEELSALDATPTQRWFLRVAKLLSNWLQQHMQIIYPLALISQTASIWTTCLITVERYLAVCHPFRALSLSTRSRAVVSLVLLSGAALLYNLPRFAEISVSGSGGQVQVQKTPLRMSLIYYWFYYIFLNLAMIYVLPLTLLSYLNIQIYIAVRNASKNRSTLTRSQESELNIATMLLLVVTVFIFCNMPGFIVTVMELCDAPYMQVFTIFSNVLVCVNSSTNFVIYSIFGKKFRAKLKEVFTCHGGISQPNIQHNNTFLSINQTAVSGVHPHTRVLPSTPSPLSQAAGMVGIKPDALTLPNAGGNSYGRFSSRQRSFALANNAAERKFSLETRRRSSQPTRDNQSHANPNNPHIETSCNASSMNNNSLEYNDGLGTVSFGVNGRTHSRKGSHTAETFV